MQLTALSLVMIAAVAAPVTAAADPISIRVRNDAFFTNRDGTLVFRDDAIEFQTRDAAGPRRWAYDRLTRIVIDGPRKLRLRTGDDRGWLCLGTLGRYSFNVLDGEIGPELLDFLLRRVPAPVVSKIVPNDQAWAFRLAARHERRRQSSTGELRLAPNGDVAFVSTKDDATRFWRRRDIASILPLDDDRLQVEVVEVRGGRPKTYVFRLQQPLPAGAYGLLWARINRGGRS